MDEARMKALNAGANMSTGGSNFDFVDTSKLERLGITKYNTKKPKGNNFIRIVAPSTTGPFAMEIHIHTQIGSGKSTFLCMKEMFNMDCPICNHAQELRRQNISSDVINDLKTSRRFLLYVVDTTDVASEDEGTHWFDCPPSIYKAVCTLSQDRRTGEKVDPTDPVDGRDIEFTRKDGKRTEYVGFVLTKTEPIPKSWYEDLPPFEDILLKPDPDEMALAVSGVKATPTTSESAGKSSTEGSRSRRESREPEKETAQEPLEKETTRASRRERVSASDTQFESTKEVVEDSEQAAVIKAKIADVQSRRRRTE